MVGNLGFHCEKRGKRIDCGQERKDLQCIMGLRHQQSKYSQFLLSTEKGGCVTFPGRYKQIPVLFS